MSTVPTEGTGRIWLNNVECMGDERTLMNCVANTSGINPCTHADDVSIKCLSGMLTSCHHIKGASTYQIS